jgi:hypothetical protein
MSSQRTIGLAILLVGVMLLGWNQGWFRSRTASSTNDRAAGSALVINKEPPAFAQRSFDPAAPPEDMPPLGEGEEAECDSNYVSNASLGGELKRLDSANAIVTVTSVKFTLQLKINIWVPLNASQHVIEHEQGHRQISEHYYQDADHVARKIAESYLGRTVSINGNDLDAEFAKTLRRLSANITADYNDKLAPGPTQQRYDDLTDHSRNDVSASDAVVQALRETQISAQ